MAKPLLPRVTEPDEDLVHFAPPIGLDQVTMCGKTDWISDKQQGEETTDPVTCWHCQVIADHFKRYRTP